MTTPTPRKRKPASPLVRIPSHGDPGPIQSKVNTRQGVVNDKQGDLNEVLLAGRQDRAEARAERAEAQAGSDDAGRTAEFEAQAKTNAEAATITTRRDAEHEAQAETNAAQARINAAAVETLREVSAAAAAVTDLLRASAARARRWTTALAVVVLLVVVLGGLGFARFRSVTDESARQRNSLQAQATASRRQANVLTEQQRSTKLQTARFCASTAKRSAQVNAELAYLVRVATTGSKNADTRRFAAGYPAHLRHVLAPTGCP